MTTSKLVPIIDADSIVYRCGFASDSNNDRTGEPLSYCLHSVKESINRLVEKFEPSPRTRVLLQGKGNYRDSIATILPYKGNRDPSKRPTWYDEIREYLVEYHGAELIHGMETDDAVGIEQWKHRNRSTCIVTIDKDLDCIPGWHYNYVREEFYDVSLAQANKNFWMQVLTGDTTDNIQGIPKVGPKTAQKILEGLVDWVDLHNAVLAAYESKGLTRADFHENATLLWIQREEGVNYDGNKFHVSGDSGDYPEGQDGEEASELPDSATSRSDS